MAPESKLLTGRHCFIDMAAVSNIYLVFFAVFSILVSGCAASVGAESAKIETPPPSEVVDHANNLVESAILSKISTLGPGVESTAGDVSFIAGETFASASGLRCRPVTITESSPTGKSRGRIVCKNDQSWFFSRDIYLKDFQSD
jgi:hypothetical protein